MTDIQQFRPQQVATQATVVEQARAAMEVQAAVTVAQANPRNESHVVDRMIATCSRFAVAAKAKYSVPNRGTGASVHLARELARIWGNLDYGVRELNRDDVAGVSEIQAFAWDQETNVRSTRTFVVPHEKSTRQAGRKKLVDLGDIYLNNQNAGAKAVRECIFSVMPDWFIDQALEQCERTVAHGADLKSGAAVPLEDRVQKMLGMFAALNVSEQQIAKRLGKPRSQWGAAELATLLPVHSSMTQEGLPASDFFDVASAPGSVLEQAALGG